MKNLLIGLFVALLLPAIGGCDKIAELREKLPLGGEAEERTSEAEQEPGEQEMAMAEAVAKAMAEASSELSEEGSAEEEPAGSEKEDESEKPAELSLVDRAKQLAEMRREIEEDPSSIDEVLAEAEMTEDELEELIFQIAGDPEAGAAYVGSL